MRDNNELYLEGYFAHQFGFDVSTNPYEGEEATSWSLGFEDATDNAQQKEVSYVESEL